MQKLEFETKIHKFQGEDYPQFVSTTEKFVISSCRLMGYRGHQYETMIFPVEDGENSYRDIYCSRSDSSFELLKEHVAVVERVLKGEFDE